MRVAAVCYNSAVVYRLTEGFAMRTLVVLSCYALLIGACAATVSAAEEAKLVVAVTSFTNLNKDAATDWLSTGIGETLTVKLGQVPSLAVVERMRLADAMKELKLQDTAVVDANTAAKLGKVVGAQTIVLGAIQKSGEQLRLTARFVEADTGKISNTAQADGTMTDVFALQDRLANVLLATLNVKVTDDVNTKMTAKPTENMAAYESYSKGVSSMQSGNYDKAAEQLKQATAADPSFKLAEETLQFVQWARPNARSAVFLAKLDAPFDKVYAAMLKVVKSGEGACKYFKDDKTAGKIEAKTSWNWKSNGQDIDINLRTIGAMTGVNIVSQTKRAMFGIRQKVDWGESRRSIGRLLRGFYREMGIAAP